MRAFVVLGVVLASLGAAAASGGAELSSNWAGYVVTGTASPRAPAEFTSVSASWRVPRVSCRAREDGTGAAMWVGLGGFRRSSGTLVQIGTDSDCDAGRPHYYAWWEVLPASSSKLRLLVSPGDLVAASVDVTPAGVRLRIENRSTGLAVTRHASPPSESAESAEWILEAPSVCRLGDCTIVPLARFVTATFRSATTTGNGIAAPAGDAMWAHTAIRLAPGASHFYPEGPFPDVSAEKSKSGAAPGSFSTDGTSFTVAWRPR